MKIKTFVTLLLLSGIALISCSEQPLTEAQKLEKFFMKKNVNILVTDSGLGGLSVAADVYERLKGSGVFESANVIFFNAQPHLSSGYNSVDTDEQKIGMFESALNAMEKNFKPDILLIACNTLSVIYPKTEYSQKVNYPVIGIVETGVQLIQSELQKQPDADVFIYATKTTVQQNTHKRMLTEQGADGDKITTEACLKLAGAIERGSHDEHTRELVREYVDESLVNYQPSEKPVLVSFNCTHYGYVSDLFAEEFNRHGITNFKLLDPNPLMADFIFEQQRINRYPDTKVTIRVVSQPELNEDKIASIGNLIEKQSAETAQALYAFEFTPELFEWKKYAGVKE
jgi:glutamate racemase